MSHPSRQVGWFLLPWAIGFILLTLLPTVASLGLSCVRTDAGPSWAGFSWVGSEHYRTAIGVNHTYEPTSNDPWHWRVLGGRPNDPSFYKALCNSLYYTFFAVPLGLCASLAVAMLLNGSFRGMSVVRACVYLPHVLGGVATIVIWSWLLNPQFGWISQGIRVVYSVLDPLVSWFSQAGTRSWPVPDWLYSPAGCKPAVIIMHIWTMGGAMLIFLAALRRVPHELYEAGRLDGAGAWHRFRYVTLPQITPAVLFNLIFSVIFTMQAFSEAYMLQNRQQYDGLLFYMLYLYQVAFEPPYQFGYASALAWILFAVLAALIIPLLWTSRRWVHYAVER